MSGRLNLLGALLAVGVVALVPSLSAAPPPPPSGPPATPTSVSAAGANKSIVVSWSATSTGAVTYVATAHGSGKTHSCTTKKRSCVVVSLDNGGVYDVTVVAKDKGATSTSSIAASARVGVPGPPRNVKLSSGSATLSVAWSAPVASGASKLTNFMATASPGGFSCSTSGTILSQPPGRTCMITGLVPGSTYTVTVTATNSYGTGSPSAGVASTV